MKDFCVLPAEVCGPDSLWSNDGKIHIPAGKSIIKYSLVVPHAKKSTVIVSPVISHTQTTYTLKNIHTCNTDVYLCKIPVMSSQTVWTQERRTVRHC